MPDEDHYLFSPQALLAQHRLRVRQRLNLVITGIEPRRKEAMPEADKDEVQLQVLRQMESSGRRAFRGPIALRLRLDTTEKNPTHSHHVAKNLLDLFGKPRRSVPTGRRALLYPDDQQVHALSVTCRHGESEPTISLTASPLRGVLDDLKLARKDAGERGDSFGEREGKLHLEGAVEEFANLRRDGSEFRRIWGDSVYESWLRMYRQRAQEAVLGGVALRPRDVEVLYDRSLAEVGVDFRTMFERLFFSTPLRIELSELPQVDGSSDIWRAEIDTKLKDFLNKFRGLIDPLLIPVSLEVLIKAPPDTRRRGLHDLDNVLRKYLIPKVVDILKPPSDLAFTFDFEAMKRAAAKSGGRFRLGAGPKVPPASTRFGVTRYEAWRLPPARNGEKGFVGLAVVADSSSCGDVLGQINDEIKRWSERLERRR